MLRPDPKFTNSQFTFITCETGADGGRFARSVSSEFGGISVKTNVNLIGVDFVEGPKPSNVTLYIAPGSWTVFNP
jgi:hypothetical protein